MMMQGFGRTGPHPKCNGGGGGGGRARHYSNNTMVPERMRDMTETARIISLDTCAFHIPK